MHPRYSVFDLRCRQLAHLRPPETNSLPTSMVWIVVEWIGLLRNRYGVETAVREGFLSGLWAEVEGYLAETESAEYFEITSLF